MSCMMLKVLSDGEIETLRERTLDVFEKVGITVGHDEALRLLGKAGAKVSEPNGRVKFPPALVRELISQAPAAFSETGLNGNVLEIGGDRRYYVSLIIDPVVVEYQGDPRPPVLEDVRRHVIIGESLNRVSQMMRMQYPVADVPEPDSYYKTLEVFLSHTTKHTAAYATSEANCRDWMDVTALIAEAAGLDVTTTPLLSLAAAVTSPLQLHGLNVEIIRMAQERCYPVIPTVCPMAGSTSPYSVAGTLLQSNVESLAVVLVTQALKPGHPVFYGIAPSVVEMKSGRDLYYKAEKMVFKTAANQLADSYGLPISGEAGGTLTHRPDFQNGAESAAYMLASVVSGQDVIGGLGSLYNANGMSAEQIIMQAGLVDMAEYIARGVSMDERRLGFDAIERTGPGGNYLTDDLTLELLRTDEFFETPYFDLSGGYDPQAPGTYEIAHETAERLVADHEPRAPGRVREAVERFCDQKYQHNETRAMRT